MKQHLHNTKDSINVLSIYDKSGYTPIMYAAYKNHEGACKILIDFIIGVEEAKGN